MKLRLIVLFVSIICSHIYADSLEAPKPYISPSENGTYFFTMVPAENNDINSKAWGKAYRLNSDGSMSLLWKVEGWYAYQVLLSDDGKYLLRIGNWPLGCAISSLDLAIAFYKEGKLLKSYSTEDFIQKDSSIKCTASHYIWVKDYTMGYNHEFNLETIEDMKLTFDIRTGDVIKINGD